MKVSGILAFRDRSHSIAVIIILMIMANSIQLTEFVSPLTLASLLDLE